MPRNTLEVKTLRAFPGGTPVSQGRGGSSSRLGYKSRIKSLRVFRMKRNILNCESIFRIKR